MLHAITGTTTDLAKSTALLQLHAEDSASRLGSLEAGLATRRADGSEPITPMTTVVRVAANNTQPNGHGDPLLPRGQDSGVPRQPEPPPGSGTFRHAPQVFDREPELEDSRYSHHHHRTSFGGTPKMDFSKFNGEDHQIWLDNCELYFEIYGVSAPMKVKFAALNMIGDAALWLKTTQKRKKNVHWGEMGEAVIERWGKSKHTFYMRQMLVLSQTSSVSDYTTKFNTLKHEILLEDPYASEVFFVERYLAGLRCDIHSVVVLHFPIDTESASLLASLQETGLDVEKLYSHH
jgi:hypothetical protein